ncbi:hypothetical protein KM043_001956 [Ampulex compressa]|nr:hypothetical protein KM043_001956 [Ampulex compressa]
MQAGKHRRSNASTGMTNDDFFLDVARMKGPTEPRNRGLMREREYRRSSTQGRRNPNKKQRTADTLDHGGPPRIFGLPGIRPSNDLESAEAPQSRSVTNGCERAEIDSREDRTAASAPDYRSSNRQKTSFSALEEPPASPMGLRKSLLAPERSLRFEAFSYGPRNRAERRIAANGSKGRTLAASSAHYPSLEIGKHSAPISNAIEELGGASRVSRRPHGFLCASRSPHR